MSFQFSRGMVVGLALVGGAAAAVGCDAIAGIQSGTLSGGGAGDGGADSTASDGQAGDSSAADTSVGGDSGSPDSTPTGDAGGDGGDAGGDPVVQISAGGAASCAVTRSGALYCWGANLSGAVGDGTTTMKPSAVHITKDITGTTLPPLTQVSAGEEHVCARSNAGAVYCWGNDSAGQLGDGVNVLTDAAVGSTDKHAPQLVAGIMAPAVACGFFHTCTLQSNGSTICWGSNQSGELGHQPGTSGDVNLGAFFAFYANSTPMTGATVMGSTQLSLGTDFTCANDTGRRLELLLGHQLRRTAGRPRGRRRQSRVQPRAGQGRLDRRDDGRQGGRGVERSRTCVRSRRAGRPLLLGKLGCGTARDCGGRGLEHLLLRDDDHVVREPRRGGRLEHVRHRCDPAREVLGGNANGQLGHDPTTDPISSCPDNSGPCNPNPSTVMSGTNPFGPAFAISVGTQFACVLKTDATVWCWGDNSGGQLGNNQQGANDAGQNYDPVQVIGLP